MVFCFVVINISSFCSSRWRLLCARSAGRLRSLTQALSLQSVIVHNGKYFKDYHRRDFSRFISSCTFGIFTVSSKELSEYFFSQEGVQRAEEVHQETDRKHEITSWFILLWLFKELNHTLSGPSTTRRCTMKTPVTLWCKNHFTLTNSFIMYKNEWNLKEVWNPTTLSYEAVKL